jgi:uncharacterized protein (TIGR02270 family)
MPTLTQTFLVELYEEHLEEASFLYEQRPALFRNPELSWRRIGEFEERLEAHIDALVLGEELAIEVCKRRASEGGFGETHAAVRVFCRQGRKDLVWTLLGELDTRDVARATAIADALKYEVPESWQQEVADLLDRPQHHLVLIALEVVGYRRFGAGRALTRILENPLESLVARTIWALGRLRERQAEPRIFRFLTDTNGPVRSAAALALLRLGNEQALDYCLRRATSEAWAILPSALGGGRNAHEILLTLTGGNARPDCIAGLGLLGYAAAIPTLIQCLSNDVTAAAAAGALQRITGASFQEKVFLPEEVNEDELFPDEREGLKHGQMPLRPDGKPYGISVTRPLQKAEHWQQWWKQRESSMDPALRYRNGLAYSPDSLVEDLEQETTLHEARRLVCEELVIRYGCDIPLEADMYVSQQMETLRSVSKWAREHVSEFAGGRAYFAGRPNGY